VSFDTDRPASWQRCGACGEELVELDPSIRCRQCRGLLEIRHREPALGGAPLREMLDARRPEPTEPGVSGVWRFGELVMPGLDSDPVSHPEGNTPLLARPSLSEYTGVADLELKHEGHNPTGSFKDRGMTVGVTQAVRIGARGVVCASTGNTSASLAAYAAQAGLPAFVLVPDGQVALGKLAQTIGYGARVLRVRGDFDACLAMVEAGSESLGLYLLNSVNPWRVEGQKTIIFELLQQRRWEPPDWIVLPGGNLGNTSAFGKALEEAAAWGLIDRVPRLLVVQAEGAAPFARGFDDGFRERIRVPASTVATAIRIGDPASWGRAVQAIRFTNGAVMMVSDQEIMAAKAAIDRSGIGCEPASAATLAGLRRAVEGGRILPGESVVAILTGHMLKDPEVLMAVGGERGSPIEPTQAAFAAAVGAAPGPRIYSRHVPGT
jgi:threonine synthase